MYPISPLCIVLLCLRICLCKDRDYAVFKGCKGHVLVLCHANTAVIDCILTPKLPLCLKHCEKVLLHFILQGFLVVLQTIPCTQLDISNSLLMAASALLLELRVLSGGKWLSIGISRILVCRSHWGQGSNGRRVVASRSSGWPCFPSHFLIFLAFPDLPQVASSGWWWERNRSWWVQILLCFMRRSLRDRVVTLCWRSSLSAFLVGCCSLCVAPDGPAGRGFLIWTHCTGPLQAIEVRHKPEGKGIPKHLQGAGSRVRKQKQGLLMAMLYLMCPFLLLAFLTAPPLSICCASWTSEFTAPGRAASEGLIVQLPVTQNNTWGSDEQPQALTQCQPSGCLNPPVKRRVPVATSVSLTRKTVHVIYAFSIWLSVSGDGRHALEGGKELSSGLETRKEPKKLHFQTVLCWNKDLSISALLPQIPVLWHHSCCPAGLEAAPIRLDCISLADVAKCWGGMLSP